MGDVADILGMNEKQNSSADVAAKFFAEKPKDLGKVKKKPKGMSREVFDLIGKDSLIPSMQSNASLATGAFKSKRASALKGKWVWASFTNSARSKEEGNTPFYHWVKADVQYTDYPYSKFNVKLDQIIFSDEEYEHLLKSDKWTRAETDHLMYICYKYDLRWPVIADRYMLIPLKKIEDIQERYYKIVTKIRAHRVNKADCSIKNEPVTIFDCETERNRRKQQECLFQKTKSEEGEEVKLREELKMIDAVLRSKKEKVAKLTGADSKNAISKQVAAIANPNASNSSPFTLPIPSDNGPAPGRPCLQSTRLVASDQSSGLSRVLLKKMSSVLRELGVSETPVPTRSVCDAYDTVKKDTITLLSIYNAIQKKEKEIASLKGLNPSESAHGDIIIPHGSALFSKMASMDPSRPFSASSPPLIQAPQSLAIHIPSLQGKVNKGPIPTAQPSGAMPLPVAVNPSTQARNSSTFPSSSSAYHTNAYSNQTNIKPGFEVAAAAEAVTFPSSSGPSEPVKKLSSYKRKMAAIAEANVSSQGQGYQIGNIGGIGPPKEKKQKKQ